MEKTIKAAGYLRVSTQSQVDEGESLTTQHKQVEEFIQQKGWELTNIYSDEGLSGTKMESRIEFQKMLKEAKAMHFDVIVFTKLSRFARNAREYLNMAHELEGYGVQLASIKENIDPTSRSGKMIAGILALFAEWEHETIQEQMSENKMARWREFRSFIGKPPFGYRWNAEKKQLEIFEKEAAVYHRIVTMYLDQKLSFNNIALQLRSEGLISKRSLWTNVSISYVLKNPAYCGNYLVNQFMYEDSNQGAGRKRTKIKKPVSEMIDFPIPKLISKARWNEIQEMITFNTNKSKRSESTSEFFLRDVLICGRCGARIKPRVGNIKKFDTRLRYYCCFWAGTSSKNLKSRGRDKCSLPFIKAQQIENAVWADISAMFVLNPEIAFGGIFDPEKFKEQIGEYEETIKRLELDQIHKQKERSNLFKLTKFEDMDEDELHGKLQKNSEEIKEIESNVEDFRIKLEEIKSLQNREKEVSEFILNNQAQLKKLRQDISDLGDEDKKTLVEAMLIGPIIVDYQDDDPNEGPGGATPSYKLKFNPDILQRFMDEGKIKLDNDGAHYLNLINNYLTT